MPERLGRYILERKLAAGGMAEIFLARQSGPEGFQKTCVIKRMISTLVEQEDFIRMFLDEARLAAQLNHPNIAQIFDFGEVNGAYYLAMEYVPGNNLRQIVKDYARRNKLIPFHLAARMVAQAAVALDYAHNAVDEAGQPLHLVHRDVSPQNVLLGTTGVIKLIDFGVAKAASAQHHTRTGLVKGKFAYMSPEQIRGQPLDKRSDIYGLGLVLYELLAARRAIDGKTDVEIMQLALKMQIPPLDQVRSGVPPRLLSILERALKREREERYSDAAQMSFELESFLTEAGFSVSGADLAAILPEDPNAPTKPIRGMGPPVPSGVVNASGPGPHSVQVAVAKAPPAGTFWELDENVRTVIESEGRQVRAPDPQASESTSMMPIAPEPPRVEPEFGVTATGGPDFKEATGDSSSDVSDPAQVSSLPSQRRNRIIASAVVMAAVAGAVLLIGLRAATSHPSAPGDPVAIAPTPEPVAKPSPPPPPVAAPEPSHATAPAPPERTEARAEERPPEPHPHPDKSPAEKAPPRPARAGPKAGPVRVASAPSAILSFDSTPKTQVTVDGRAHGQTPASVAVTPGTHTIRFSAPALGLSTERTIKVQAGDRLTEEWRPAKGRVVIRAVPYAEVTAGSQSLGLTPFDPVEMWEGRHTFKFFNKETQKSETRVVEVLPGRETMVKVDLRASH